MKDVKRVISFLLCAAMIFSLLPVMPVSAAEGDTYFYSSFEVGAAGQTDKEPLADVVALDADGNPKAQGMGGSRTFYPLLGNFTSKVVEVTGTPSLNDNENLDMLADGNPATKYLTATLTSTSGPVVVTYKLSEATVLGAYELVAANDEQDRDPKAWKIYGSQDNENWTELDSRIDQVFADRFQVNAYDVKNTEAYLYYKLEISERYGPLANNDNGRMVQLADWNLGTGLDEPVTKQGQLITKNSTGPSSTWAQNNNVGWTGSNAYQVTGTHEAEGAAYCWNVIYDDLEIAVKEDTQLSYMIFPDYVSEYDYEYAAQYMAIDLKFTDGTYLSQLEALDQNGNVVSPRAQGDVHILKTKSWNHIYSNIGHYANGKVIEEILVGYDKPTRSAYDKGQLRVYFDDITIEEVQPKVYEKLTDYVNTMRGTAQKNLDISHGLCSPAVTVPFGFNYWTPCSTNSGRPLYFYQDRTITHFSISHEASFHIQDRGTFQFMVNTSLDPATASQNQAQASSRKSTYDYDTSVAQAHYFSAIFDKNTPAGGAQVEITPTEHAAVIRFTYPSDSQYKNVIFDSVNDTRNSTLTYHEDGTFEGMTSHLNGNGMRPMYFYGYFDSVPTTTRVINGARAMGIASFEDSVVEMKIATSFMSVEQAKKNLELEITAEDTFDTVKKAAEDLWNDYLGLIEIEGGTEEQLITFYSGMYHLFMYPTLLSENTGTAEEPDWAYTSPYQGTDDNIEVVHGYKFYYNNGFWDTFRTSWPAYSLLIPDKATELLNGITQHYIDNGWLPRWIAPGGNDCMVGTSSDVIFGDALMRGIDFDLEPAYESAVKNASVYSSSTTNGRNGLQTSIFEGYMYETGRNTFGFSWAMENYVNDYGIAQMAKALGNEDEYVYFINRAQYYTLYFNTENGGWFNGKNADGSWYSANNALDPKTWGGPFTETNGWNMQFTPQDGQGLANLLGSKDALGAKLDALFNETNEFITGGYGNTSKEMIEAREVKMGQFGFSNQPSHHIPYMYNYASQPYKTQYRVREILNKLFINGDVGQGYSGDFDNGEMDAWYVLSSIGFYPVDVGSGEFTITSPLFDKVTLHLDHDIVITANNNSKDNCYIQSMTIDGKENTKLGISHQDFISAHEIVFNLGAEPSSWGTGDDDVPTSITTGTDVPHPIIDMTSKTTQSVDELPAADSVFDALYVDAEIQNPTYLINNTSANSSTIQGTKASIYYYFAVPEIVELYTLTSYTDTGLMPDSIKLLASNDGKTWTELDARSDVDFQWVKYTKPFAIDNETAYKYYRLDVAITGETDAETMRICQVELLGNVFKAATKEALLSVIEGAKRFDGDDYYAECYEALQDAIAEGQKVYDDPDATSEEIYDAIVAINDAIANLLASAECDVVSGNDPLEIGETEITATVSNHVVSLDLTNMIEVSDKATWKMYSDEACENETSKVITPLRAGDNVRYIQVTAENLLATKVYTVTITRETSTIGKATPTMDGTLGSAAWGDKVFTVAAGEESTEVMFTQEPSEAFNMDIYLAYDEENLYLGLDVTDPDWIAAQAGSNLWQGCGIQLGLWRGIDGSMSEYGFGLSSTGPAHWQWRTATGATSLPTNYSNYEIKRVSDDEFVYTIAIPLSSFAADAEENPLTEGEELMFSISYNCPNGSGNMSCAFNMGFHTKSVNDARYLVLGSQSLESLLEEVEKAQKAAEAAAEAAKAAQEAAEEAAKAAQEAAESTAEDKAAAEKAAEEAAEAQKRAEEAQKAAEDAQRAAEAAAKAAEESNLAAAEEARKAAEEAAKSAVSAAEAAKYAGQAAEAQKGAQEAREAAENAQAAAEEAQRKAEAAQKAAEEAAASAAEDKQAAENAAKEAEEAKQAAEAAQKAAEDAEAAARAAEEAAAAHDAAAAAAAAEAARYAQEVAEKYQEICEMKAEMARYLLDAQKAAEEAEASRKAAAEAELACAKYYALFTLATYADREDYAPAEQAELAEAVKSGSAAISAADTVEEVEKALADAKSVIDAIKTLADLEAEKLPFVDVKESDWFYDAVKYVYSNGLMQGVSETAFSPNGKLTRGQMVTLLYRLADSPEVKEPSPFTDVKADAYYAKAIAWAYENKIAFGVTETEFKPNQNVTREQMAAFLARYAQYQGVYVEAAQDLSRFPDAGKTSKYAVPYMAWAAENGIIEGVGTGLNPTGTAVRSQAATIIMRYDSIFG